MMRRAGPIGVLEGAVQMMKRINDWDLLYLKYGKRFSTQSLLRHFPREKKRIEMIALLDIREPVLHEIIKQESKMLSRLQCLKKKLQRFREQQRLEQFDEGERKREEMLGERPPQGGKPYGFQGAQKDSGGGRRKAYP